MRMQKLNGYHIVSEDHLAMSGTRFSYSIRRVDGSLVFRAGTWEHAEILLARLIQFAGR